jgi:hypothetical protein
MVAPTNSPLGLTPTGALSPTPSGKPPLGVFELLTEQHRDVLELLREAGSVHDANKREPRWAEARRRLLSHERAEVEVIYGSIDTQEYARPVLGQHAAQASELEAAVAELDTTDIESDAWIARLRDLMAMLDDHVRDEETEFFPMAQRVLGDQRAVELQERYESEQREVLHALANETR